MSASSIRSEAGTPAELGPGVEVGGFRIQRWLGAGTTGEVWAAQDLALGRRVALKFIRRERLSATSVERFLAEARTTARFSHPNIVAIHSVGERDGRPYLALELLEGDSLRSRISKAPLPLLETIRVGQAIAEAMAEAHRHGIIHRDLKPENVILSLDGRLRVLDFGLARPATGAGGGGSGTPAYLAPESWRGVSAGPPDDVWALGIILFECATGRRPVADADVPRLAFHPRPIALPPPLAAHPLGSVVAGCLSIEPAQRPSAAEVVGALTALLDRSSSLEPDRPPFRGLRPFSEADAQDFHGRGAEVASLVERLRADPVALVVGPSGAGKTSLIHAGLVPRLREATPWQVLALRPGAQPLEALARAVIGDEPAGASSWAQTLRDRPGALVQALRGRFAAAPVLVAIDAFEELFTLAPEEARAPFADCLGALAASDEPWRVVISIRDEYLGRLAALPSLRPALGAACVVGPLGPGALRRAVEAPLARAGYRADDPRLVSTLVDEVSSQRAGLPALQFVAQLLWERRDRERQLICFDVYREVGGVGGALAAHARQVLHLLTPEELQVARRLLLRLVTPEGTRQPRALDELLEDGSPSIRRTLDVLIDHRLLSVRQDGAADRPAVELAHEALTSAWPELARWIDESHEDRAALAELEQATALWERRGRRDEETWTGEAVRQALRRLDSGQLSATEAARRFLIAGRERERRRVVRRRSLSLGLVGLLGVAAVVSTLTAIAFRNKEREAVRQQAEIRLAAADIGEFDLLLQPHDFDGEQWTAAPTSRPAHWELFPAGGNGPYPEGDVIRGPATVDPAGGHRQRVEAPARQAILEIHRPGCASSRVHLRQLPRFAERGQVPTPTVAVPYPTCAASSFGMVEIPAGPYLQPPASPQHEEERVEVAAFAIDRTEVTNAQFSVFESQLLPLSPFERVPPPRHPVYAHAWSPRSPVTGVDAITAAAFCEYLGKSLPTFVEWQKAARGGLQLDAAGKVLNASPRRLYPWTAAVGVPANILGADTFAGPAPVGSFPEDRSPYGVLDLAGNVAEWTATEASLPQFPNLRVVAGGRWDAPADTRQHEVVWMNHLPARRFDFAIGIRCAAREPKS